MQDYLAKLVLSMNTAGAMGNGPNRSRFVAPAAKETLTVYEIETEMVSERRKTMGKKSRVSDEQILELIEKGLINSHIARELGVTLGSISVRCNQLRKNHNPLPEPEQKTPRRKINLDSLPEVESPPSLQENKLADTTPAEPVKLDPFPFEPKEQVKFGGLLHTVREVTKNKLVMYENCSLRRITITLEEWNRDKGIVISSKEKPQNTYEKVTRNHRPDEEPEDVKASGTIFEKVAIERADRKPGMTINPEFEVAVQEMERENKAAQESKSVEDLFHQAEATRPCVHFLQDCAYPEDFDCDKCSDYQDALAIAEDAEKAEPFNLDLEMDSLSDPEPFDSVDYVDPAWQKEEGPTYCARCGKKLTAVEEHYYDTHCEACERKLLDMPDTVIARREYLDRIDQLLDLMGPMMKNKDVAYKATGLAISILTAGVNEEARA